MSPTKTILITGCSADGIGAAMALALAQRGHHVFATARNPAKIPEALTSLSNVTVLPLDVADTHSVAAAARAVVDTGRGLDVLVNNAGVGYVRPVLDIDIAAAQRLHDINLWGPLRTIQAFQGLLVASRGRIVNVSSSASVVYSPWVCTFMPVSPLPDYLTIHWLLNAFSRTSQMFLMFQASFSCPAHVLLNLAKCSWLIPRGVGKPNSDIRRVQGGVELSLRDATAGARSIRRERRHHLARGHRQQSPRQRRGRF